MTNILLKKRESESTIICKNQMLCSKELGKLLNVGLMFIWKHKVSTFQASLPSLLGIVEPSDKIDIIFHHANEMTNTVSFLPKSGF